jgi:DNA replication initiation complex subunit (GINS family)
MNDTKETEKISSIRTIPIIAGVDKKDGKASEKQEIRSVHTKTAGREGTCHSLHQRPPKEWTKRMHRVLSAPITDHEQKRNQVLLETAFGEGSLRRCSETSSPTSSSTSSLLDSSSDEETKKGVKTKGDNDDTNKENDENET